ncbi:PAS domain-containing sensor histidine kinase [Pseudomonas segetis]
MRRGSIVLAGAIFIIDTATSLTIAVAVLYVTVILMSVAVFSYRGVLGITLGCMLLTIASFWISHPISPTSQAFTRCLVSLIAISVTALFALRNKAANDELHVQLSQLSQTHDAIMIRTLEGTVTHWNRGAETLYGWSRSEAIGKNLVELIRLKPQQPLEEIVSTVLQTGSWESEPDSFKRNGERMTVASRCTLLRDKRGKPVGILATHNDVTERNQAVKALRRSEAFLAGAQRISRTSSIGIKVPGGEIYGSEEARRILEFNEDERPSLLSLVDKTHPEDRTIIEQAIRDVLKDEPKIDLEYRLQMADGRIKYVHMLTHPVRDCSGNREYVGALMDVTASKLAEEALHRSQIELAHITRITTLGELVASIAHEVNQPLAAMAANGEAGLRWLSRDQPDLDEAAICIQRMLAEARRASEVILRIRALSKKDDPQYRSLDLREVVEESLALMRAEAKHHNVRLSAVLPNACFLVHGDRVQLQQVIINLIMNAMQAMAGQDKKRRLGVQLRYSAQREPLLAVIDSGPGIDPLLLPDIFEPFFTTKAQGMGMGLPICRAIIEKHGGRIWADPHATQGATICVSLPPVTS